MHDVNTRTTNMETIRNTLSENLGGIGHNLAAEENKFSLDEVPDLSGKVAVVTGGSEGMDIDL